MLAFTAAIIAGLSFFPAPYVIDNSGPTFGDDPVGVARRRHDGDTVGQPGEFARVV